MNLSPLSGVQDEATWYDVPMTDISPHTSSVPARRSILTPLAGGLVVGGVIVAVIGVVPLIILAVLVILAKIFL